MSGFWSFLNLAYINKEASKSLINRAISKHFSVSNKSTLKFSRQRCASAIVCLDEISLNQSHGSVLSLPTHRMYLDYWRTLIVGEAIG